jgi:hypothetical protein
MTVSVRRWSRSVVSDLPELTNSNPDAVLGETNLAVVTDDPEAARDVTRRLEGTDVGVTSITYGRPRSESSPEAARVEGVADHTARRAGRGAALGAIVGAVVLGLGAGLVASSGVAVMAAAIGGALFGSIAGGVWNFVIGTGQSDAYLETFVGKSEGVVSVVVVQGSAEQVAAVIRKLDGRPGVRLLRTDADGEVLGEV